MAEATDNNQENQQEEGAVAQPNQAQILDDLTVLQQAAPELEQAEGVAPPVEPATVTADDPSLQRELSEKIPNPELPEGATRTTFLPETEGSITEDERRATEQITVAPTNTQGGSIDQGLEVSTIQLDGNGNDNGSDGSVTSQGSTPSGEPTGTVEPVTEEVVEPTAELPPEPTPEPTPEVTPEPPTNEQPPTVDPAPPTDPELPAPPPTRR